MAIEALQDFANNVSALKQYIVPSKRTEDRVSSGSIEQPILRIIKSDDDVASATGIRRREAGELAKAIHSQRANPTLIKVFNDSLCSFLSHIDELFQLSEKLKGWDEAGSKYAQKISRLFDASRDFIDELDFALSQFEEEALNPLIETIQEFKSRVMQRSLPQAKERLVKK